MELFGIGFVGATAGNGQKLLLTLAFVGAVWAARRGLHALARQAINLGTTLLLVLGLLSVWLDDPTRPATALGLVIAGLAFAPRRVVTAVAGSVATRRGVALIGGGRYAVGGDAPLVRQA